MKLAKITRTKRYVDNLKNRVKELEKILEPNCPMALIYFDTKNKSASVLLLNRMEYFFITQPTVSGIIKGRRSFIGGYHAIIREGLK